MKVGSVVLATDQGLGYLAKDFYDNGIFTEVYVHPHRERENHYEWYPNRVEKMDDLLKCDVILFFENPFEWKFIIKCREAGVKTVLMPMYECTMFPLPYFVDKIIAPSLLELEYFPDAEYIPVPIPNHIKWKKREKAKVFVHNAGNGGLAGRNGTKELLEAIRLVPFPIKLIVRSQKKIRQVEDPRIEYRIGQFDDIWSEGDVFVFPEKFNGLSLPIQEAFASGMMVMATDRFPNNEYLPKKPLIPVQRYREESTYVNFPAAVISPNAIAKTIEHWYNKDITEYSLAGEKFKEKYSWKTLKPRYMEMLKKVCEQS